MRPTRTTTVLRAAALLSVPALALYGASPAPAAPAADPGAATASAAPPPGVIGYVSTSTRYERLDDSVTVARADGTNPLRTKLSTPTKPLALDDVEFSADGDRVVEVVRGKGLALTDGTLGPMTPVSVSPAVPVPFDVEWAPGSSSSLYAASGTDTRVHRIDLTSDRTATSTVVATFSSPAYAVRPSPDGSWLAAALQDGSWVVVRLSDGSQHTLPGGGYFGGVGWDEASGLVVTTVEDARTGQVSLHTVDPADPTSDRVLTPFPNPSEPLSPVGESDADGHPYLLGASNDPRVLATVDVATGVITLQHPLERMGNSGARDLAVASYGVTHVGLCTSYRPTITGTSGDDTIVGTPGDDIIFAGDGDDTIDGGGGNDVVCGGPGDDTITTTGTGTSHLLGGAGDDHITGGPTTDLIRGDEGNDVIDGGGGDDEVNGNDGDDTITTGAGKDTVRGGSGSDTIATGEGDDVVFPGRGIPTAPDGTRGPVDVVRTGDGNDQVLIGYSSVDADLGDGDDVYRGFFQPWEVDSARVSVRAGAGRDYVVAGGAVVDAGPDDDIVYYASIADGGDGNDLLSSARRQSNRALRLTGGAGDDTLTGGWVMLGGDGDDTIRSYSYPTRSGPPSPTSRISGGAGSDSIEGGSGPDEISGGAGDDFIQGRAGDDTIRGDSGRDKLSGGYGEDTLDGGTGLDRCHPDGDTAPTTACEVLTPQP